jgi:hypothetical protein
VEILRQKGYAYPDDRVEAMVKEGIVQAAALGWYVVGEKFRRRSLHLRWLSNVMRPSCLSMEYALRYHDLIPEDVPVLTAVTPLRSVAYDRPFGRFRYVRIPAAAFPPGQTIVTLRDSVGGEERFFLASPGKALADRVWIDRGIASAPPCDWERVLFEDLRLDEEGLARLPSEEMLRFAQAYRSRKLASLAAYLERIGGGSACQRKSSGK